LREEMQIEIREMHDKLRITTLYVTHDQREALTIADRIAVMNEGRIVQLDSPQALYRYPSDEFVARFVGEATILAVAQLALPAELAGAARKVVVRSEDFCLARTGWGEDSLGIDGILRGIVFQGDSWLLQVEVDGTTICARAQKNFADEVAALEVGRPLTLHVPFERLHFL
jgi:putative spermidine/putrescine transport system ATP-binding protein